MYKFDKSDVAMIVVKIPASAANLGAGFDCLGVALGLYNTISFSPSDSGYSVATYGNHAFIPNNEKNLIVRSMKYLFDTVSFSPQGIKIVQQSNIPMTRGLGSSSACIIGGMIAANIIAGRPLSYDEILNLAVKLEGHPDNITPAMFGGFCTTAMDNENILHNSIKLDSHLKFAVMYPKYFVATKKSRTAVPDTFSKEDCVYNISRASLLTSALASKKYDLLRIAVQDKIHQQYRKKYIEGFDEIVDMTYKNGSLATCLSGSGPTILSMINKNYSQFYTSMNNYFCSNFSEWNCRVLSIDNVGVTVRIH